MSFQRLQAAICVATALVLIANALPLVAQTLPITLSQYDRKLSMAQSDVVDAASGSELGRQSAISAVTAVAQVPVRTGPDEIVYADNRPIIAQMQAADSSRVAADQTREWTDIAVELQNIRADLPTTAGDRRQEGSAASQARAVLSTSGFASLPVVSNTYLDKFEAAISNFERWLRNRFHIRDHVGKPVAASPIFAYILLICIGAVAICLIVYFVVSIIRNRSNTYLTGAAVDSGFAVTSEERDLVASYNFSRLRELADEAARTGDYRSAFRLTFLATLVYLSSEGAVRLDRSKTNWEYLRSLTDYLEVREEIRPQVRDFDRIWYGLQEAAPSDYERAGAAYDRVRVLVEKARPGAASSAAGRKLGKAMGTT